MGEEGKPGEGIATDIFANAFRDSGIGVALVSPEGKALEVNDALCAITEYSRDELFNLTFEEITHPDDLAIDMRFVKQLQNGEIDSYNLEKRYISKHRRIIWAILTVSVARTDEGTPKFYIAQVVDISKRKNLADEIQAKNSELEATKISLINKINQLEEFSYIVAHNMRGPAANIKMFSEQLLSANLDPESAMRCGAFTFNETVSIIQQSSSALMETLEGLMTIAQVKLSKDVPHDECDIGRIIERVTEQLSGVIYEKNADLQLSLAVRSIT
ncbi:MAG: PAS domain S-box protein, partial [Taibaiella sp.]|nr:PAS domain S-box protein [Taibaiella sp.]